MKHAIFPKLLSVICLASAIALRAAAADAPAESNAVAAAVSDPVQSETMRSLLQLQEQLHDTKLLIERNREVSEKFSAKEAEALGNRLVAIEQSIATQRAQELAAMQGSNRVMLIVAGSFAGVGFLSMLLMAYLHWRAVNRLADIAAELPAARSLGAGPSLRALGNGQEMLPMVHTADQISLQLSSAMEKLEHRLKALESPPRKPLAEGEGAAAELPAASTNGDAAAAHSGTDGNGSSPGTVPGMLAKAQAAMEAEDMEGALKQLEEVLRLAPRNTDALVKKGTCLERLRNLNEAVACYDQAISIDSSLTVAYLHKGGLFNRMERFGEALECYEQALRTQEHKAAQAESMIN